MAIINGNHVPTYDFDLKNFNQPSDISGWFKSMRINKYVYRINYKGLVLKYGMSEGTQMPGERVYRQIGHSDSWNSPLVGPNGADWLIIEKLIRKAYGITDMHKDDITVKVWDLSKYRFNTVNPKYEIERIESNLIQEHLDVVGQKPIGNLCNDAASNNRTACSIDAFESLFEV